LGWHISLTYLFVIAGLFILWRTAHRLHLFWSTKLLVGALLLGFGTFNVVEGVVDHHLLGIHHVNELTAARYRMYWDVGFLIWGAAMFVIGWCLLRQGQRGRKPALDRA
jgi:uncharacterized membrane protein